MVPTPYLFSGWLQTIYLAMQARKRDQSSNVRYDRHILDLNDGGLVSLDWYPIRPIRKSSRAEDETISTIPDPKTPIVVIIPAGMSTSGEYYIRCLVKALYDKGRFRAVVLNHRGCCSTPLTTPRLLSGDYTGDLKETIAHIQSIAPGAPIGAIGFSVGANILTKYLGEQGENSNLAAAVTVGCLFDTTKSFNKMDEPSFFNDKAFQPHLTAAIRKYANQHREMILTGDAEFDFDAINKATRLKQLDTLLTSKAAGYDTCEEYYRAASSAPLVHSIATPYLAINSNDDPAVPVDAIPYEAIESNPWTALVTVDHGGHLAFFTGIFPKIWYINPALEFLGAFL
ncbi:hypothetical protein H4R20_005280 [Coemansia guatemalensis]|uniref:AB hydrolase-1 domain-containing protein n=1 Tax=Coemansia guatemalensis TaxID=2761395 RepID=A0A9W8LR99_9FUNG|nr:hypothetical protein H4R20_005280 [Coemansia guatemalensis]